METEIHVYNKKEIMWKTGLVNLIQAGHTQSENDRGGQRLCVNGW